MDLYDQLQKNGYAVIEDFLTSDEIKRLKRAGSELPHQIPKDERKAVFGTLSGVQSKDQYFVESGDKIRFFYESEALDENGELRVPAEISLNKVGHALHWLHEDFKELSFSDKVSDICHSLHFTEPTILQSMYIYKNPGIGSEVVPHQDATFLFTEPNTLIGLWFPLDDATLENGCLWFVPGSHKGDLHRRYIRNPDRNSDHLLVYDRPPTIFPEKDFVAAPVRKGSCVIIHGLVVHKSEPNKSQKSRHAYTFHIMEGTSNYSPDNWLQTEAGFQRVY